MTPLISKTGYVRQFLESYIVQERLKSGDVLYSETQLMSRTGVSRGTVRKAVEQLCEDGILEKRHGSGAFVRDPGKIDAAVPRKLRGTVVSIVTEGDFFNRILDAAEQVLGLSRVRLIRQPQSGTLEETLDEIGKRFGSGVDGLIVTPPDGRAVRENAERLAEFNCVFVNSSNEPEGTSAFYSDDLFGSYNMTRYLLTLGHRRILHLTGPLDTHVGQDRLNGYLDAMREANLEPAYIPCNFMDDAAYAETNRLFGSGAEFSAVFCASDRMALGVCKCFRRNGISIPDDISVAGYGNVSYPFCKLPGLTTVDQNPAIMGERAAQTLLAAAQGNPLLSPSPMWNAIPTQLLVRSSCAVFRKCYRFG
ncbi:MAG: GntR family transcriptional regulator [Lentisphaeria bacterium]|nr:GntR family transcriptional regulator [Lentisphaeria bacterium]